MAQDVAGCFTWLRGLFSRPASACRSDRAVLASAPNSVCRPKDNFTNDHALYCAIPCSLSSGGKVDLWLPGRDEPPPYNISSPSAIYRPDIMTTIEEEITSLDADLRALSLKIHAHPELAFQELFAHDTLTEFMRSHGFKVTPRYTGLQSAWKAEWSYGKGGRTLGINSEMDALPGIGHACGHNLIAISGVGVAIAAKAAMEKHKIPGKVVLLGTPAEEGGGGKILLIERGAYKDMDICVMCHPSPGSKHSVAPSSSLATQPLVVEYFGHPAHAAALPWEGQNALDAAVLAYNSVSMLRQQMKPDCRVHGIIEGRNWAANIIPDYAKMNWIVRAPTYPEMTDLFKRVKACIEAAALAASCRCEITLGVAYYDLRQNPVMSQEFMDTVKERYGMGSDSGGGISSASTDFGNVTYELPAIHPTFAIPTVPNGGNHTVEFTNAARTPEAHAAALAVAKGLALVGVRALNDDEFFKEVRESFDDMIAEPGSLGSSYKAMRHRELISSQALPR